MGNKEPRNILLVDSDGIIASTGKELLQRHGHRVTTAQTGRQAVTIISAHEEIEIVLTEIDIDRSMNGAETARQILALRELPILFLTDRRDKEALDLIRDIPSYGYILKASGEYVLIKVLNMAYDFFRTQKELVKKERLYRWVADNSSDGIAVIENHKTNFVSPAYLHMLGCTSLDDREISLDDLFKRVHPDDLPRVKNNIAAAIANGSKRLRHRYRIIKPDGSYAWIEDNVALFYHNGQYQFSIINGRDVTEYQLARERLSAKEREYRSLFEGAIHPIIIFDSNGVIVDLNQAAAEDVGATKEHLAGKAITSLFPGFSGVLLDRIRNCLQANKKMEYTDTVKCSEGDERHYTNIFQPTPYEAGKQRLVQLFAYDITQHKNAEIALRKSEERFSYAMEASNDGLWDWTLSSNEVYFSPACEAIVGYKPGTLPRTIASWTNMLHPEDRPAAIQAHRDCIDNKSDTFRLEQRIVSKDGTLRWILSKGKAVERDKSGKALRLVAVHTDITERKQVEEKLRKALDEKDALMREMNHRIKNNLAMVSSLISLKEFSMGPNSDLSDIRSQLEAIRTIHDKLSRSNSTLNIKLKEYITDLLTPLFLTAANMEVALHIDVPELLIPAKTGVAIGLIINEVATNAVKHGFIPSEKAEFSVVLKRLEASDDFLLILSNSGRSFPKEIDFDNSQTLGLQLIRSLTEQLGGEVELRREPWTKFLITIPRQVLGSSQ
ncbi:PAS domain S-box protein [Sediminispirochaeta bajacaliforniensis]|uniref:PAS domain S-box protein n=1 Tax=Sediminispirochaeta bajacaliforniensis TaxID=148 RepID=UPI0003784255|nr:PAS domain S-box protein [Sediminispirochaeta bajacaliforniensis]